MQTRKALQRFSGKETTLFLSDPKAIEKFKAVAEADASAIEAKKLAQRERMSQPHLRAAQQKVESALQGDFDPTLPVVSRFDAYQATKKLSANGSDNGVKHLAFHLKSLWEADPT